MPLLQAPNPVTRPYCSPASAKQGLLITGSTCMSCSVSPWLAMRNAIVLGYRLLPANVNYCKIDEWVRVLLHLILDGRISSFSLQMCRRRKLPSVDL